MNLERAATVLAEAAIYGDRKALARSGLSDRTLRNYRARLRRDPELSAIFRCKKEALEREWASALAPAIRSALAFLEEAPSRLEPSPESVHAVAGALKILAEISLTKDVLDARFGQAAAHPRQLGEVAASQRAAN